MSNVKRVETTEDIEKMLHSILAEVKDIGKRVGVLEANASPRHNLLRPEATKVVKTKTTKKAKPPKNEAHASMKAKLKLLPKAKQRLFSVNWKWLRVNEGFGTSGNTPRDAYFMLQAECYDFTSTHDVSIEEYNQA